MSLGKNIFLVFFLVFPPLVFGYGGIQNQIELINENGVYTALLDENKIIFSDLEDGDIPFRNQCGEVVNDIFFGGPHELGVGDSFLSKISKTNEREPHPGFAFFEYIPSSQYWHTGFISGIDNDGTLHIIDSNYLSDGTVRYSTISPNSSRHDSILYFYDPYKMENLQTEFFTFAVNNIFPVFMDIFIICSILSVVVYFFSWLVRLIYGVVKF